MDDASSVRPNTATHVPTSSSMAAVSDHREIKEGKEHSAGQDEGASHGM
jgi:hypothetical protein